MVKPASGHASPIAACLFDHGPYGHEEAFCSTRLEALFLYLLQDAGFLLFLSSSLPITSCAFFSLLDAVS